MPRFPVAHYKHTTTQIHTHTQEKKAALPDAKVKAQEAVDGQILKAIGKNEDMAKYLAATFTLRDRDVPHTMKF